MVSHETLEFIHRRLSEINDVRGSEQTFGGLSVICVGDFFQLPPVQAPYTFQSIQPGSRRPQSDSPGELWKEFSAFHLTTNQRQKGDTSWAQHLNAIRDGRDEAALQEAMKALRTRLDISKDSRGQVNVRDSEWANAPRCVTCPVVMHAPQTSQTMYSMCRCMCALIHLQGSMLIHELTCCCRQCAGCYLKMSVSISGMPNAWMHSRGRKLR
jgi:hypothetical protein